MRPSPKIQIREAGPQDASAIAKVLYGSFLEFESLYTPEGIEATTPNANQIKARMREGSLWIACRAERVMGTVPA